MSDPSYSISCTQPLQGCVRVSGAKNSVLPLMASSLLSDGVSRVYNVPASRDVFAMSELLEHLGCGVAYDAQEGVMSIDTRCLKKSTMDPHVMGKMRASSLIIGPLLARHGHVDLFQPGGCTIGKRPINWHIAAMQAMGATCRQATQEHQELSVSKLNPFCGILEYPSVGVTENIIMAATAVPGTTRIANAACEPEVYDLIAALRERGATIWCEAPATICVKGGVSLAPLDYTVMGDRLEAATLALAAVATGGEARIHRAPVQSMELVCAKLRQMGHEVGTDGVAQTLCVRAGKQSQAVSFRTAPYPGFPTDLQAPMMAALCCASGSSVITETVFERRFLHVPELQRMGADITVNGATATINGVSRLRGAVVQGSDIRAAAALVIAGLVAEGVTHVFGISYLERGHSDLAGMLNALGADVTSSSNAMGSALAVEHTPSIHA